LSRQRAFNLFQLIMQFQTLLIDVVWLCRSRRENRLAVRFSLLLSARDVKFIYFLFFCWWNFQRSRSIRTWFAQKMIKTFVEDFWVVMRCCSCSFELIWDLFIQSESIDINAQLICYLVAFFANHRWHVFDSHTISRLCLQSMRMYVDEKNVCFDLENQNERNAKSFEYASKTFVLNDDEFADDFRFLVLEHISNRCLVCENWTNNEDVQNASFVKNDVSRKDRHFDQNHELLDHFLFNFAHIKISFQTCVYLNAQNSYVDFRLYDVWLDFNRCFHVERSFWNF
jgi:hypothetical protein